jgi:UDP:flavonoid glycosyltransferase YjiC (YdhE family)
MLFAFVGGAGHYEPLRPIARAAVRAGHSVTFACRPSMVGVVLGDGFAAVGVGPDVEEMTSIAPLVVPGIEHEEAVLRDGFARRTALARARALFDLGGETAPEVLVGDEVDFGATIAAELLGVPHARVTVLAAGSFARPDLLVEPLNEVRAQVGLPPDPDLEMLGRDLVIVPGLPGFRDPAFPLPETARMVRPGVLEPVEIEPVEVEPVEVEPVEVEPVAVETVAVEPGPRPPRWLADLGDRPVVYATLGTIFNVESGDLFVRILDGLAALAVDVVATVGRQLDPTVLGTWPPHVHVERFVPQAHLLPQVDVVVSHGGSGSVIGALAFGVPSVLLPIGADQTHNAARVAELGVGVALDPLEATAGDIAGAVAMLLGEDGQATRTRAASLAAASAALPTAVDAVSWLEALAP